MQLRDAVRQLAGTQFMDKVYTAMAQVVSSDINTCTCSCQLIGSNATTEKLTVNLMAETDDGFLLVPANDSTVVIAWTDRMLPYVAMCSEIAAVYLDATGIIQINQGTHGGLVKVVELVQKVNNLESKVNAIISSYNAHVHPDPVSGTTGTPTIPITGPLTLTTRADVENPNVTHG